MPSRFRGGDVRRRVLSQNFLVDAGVVRRLVECSGVGPGDVVVEPGPGEGAVTGVLARRVGRVLAYERDAGLAARLSRRGWGNVVCVRADFRGVAPPVGAFHLVGNIPFGATAGIVEWCLAARSLRSATMVTQWEYARKRSGDFGRWSLLTVSTWPEVEWGLAGRVDRSAFRPVPRVDAGILRLVRRERPLLGPEELAWWRELVAAGFGGVGGSLSASLSRVVGRRRVASAFRRAGVDARVPVGHVPPWVWLELFGWL
ncbi:23S ribosomal RNA methyltransferase Erm [Phytomonospora sp. NPDC050363]|uniref:23S ribosomal RNA methyltransferase Erm n=1 Tax=Phytomonospora sp. NPDC050363 TaxID=3155642 RepID=UPI00340726FE